MLRTGNFNVQWVYYHYVVTEIGLHNQEIGKSKFVNIRSGHEQREDVIPPCKLADVILESAAGCEAIWVEGISIEASHPA